MVEAAFRAVRDGHTGYCPNAGIASLREALAADVAASHGVPYTADNVVIEPGGKPVIAKFVLALMDPGDEVLYPNPGYPIYESQIEFHGGVAVPYGYREGPAGFAIDLDALEAAITPRTRLLIVNDWQNPTGAECSAAELARLAELVLRHDLTVLCDEAYFDIRYEGRSTSLASLPGMAERCVILYTFSKKFAMTGWRLGAAIAPREVAQVIAKLNVNDESCSNHFIQYGALEGLTGDQAGPRHIVDVLRERRDAAVGLLRDTPGVRCAAPAATFYLFANVTGAMRAGGFADVESFRRAVLHETGVSVCSRLHFGSVAAASASSTCASPTRASTRRRSSRDSDGSGTTWPAARGAGACLTRTTNGKRDATTVDELLRTALFERHVAAGGRMVDFAGWEMPLQYAGIVAEHLATRRRPACSTSPTWAASSWAAPRRCRSCSTS